MTTRTATGITFRVDDVTPTTEPLETHKSHQSVAGLAEGPVEACSDYTTDCVTRVAFHPVLAAACLAHADHRPLILSPDMIWTTILQGFARHVANDPERYRRRLVSHPGKALIAVRRDDFAKRSPENPWAEVIAEFSAGVRKQVGEPYTRLVSDFGTTGPAERTACEVALLDTFSPFFELRFTAACGIPEVTLEGTAADWRHLRQKVEHLAPFELDWWLPNVRNVCDQFARASDGDVDREHWRNAWKLHQRYGVADANGWLVQLVPYLKHGWTGNFTIRNPLLTDPTAKVNTNMLPSGVSKAEFLCAWGTEGPKTYEMLGGFLGVEQKPDTLALRPKMGWAVRPAGGNTPLFARLAEHGAKPPLPPTEFDRVMGEHSEADRFREYPGDFAAFYKACDGVTLFGGAFRFRAFAELERVPSPFPKKRFERRNGTVEEFDTRGPFVRVCDLADGRYAALDFRPVLDSQRGEKYRPDYFWAVVLIDPEGPSASPPVVAWSFAEFVRVALESHGRLDGFADRSAEHKVK